MGSLKLHKNINEFACQQVSPEPHNLVSRIEELNFEVLGAIDEAGY